MPDGLGRCASVADVKVLVVDDEDAIRQVVCAWLESSGYDTVSAHNGRKGFEMFESHAPDLAVLDVMMPVMDGLELCRKIRETSQMPVIFLSALFQERDKLEGFSAGANDYLTKPFSGPELLARIETVLRTASAEQTDKQAKDDTKYSDAFLTMDFAGHIVYARGSQVNLTAIEFKLLEALVRQPGQVLTSEQLIVAGWGEADLGSVGYVKWHIRNLRKKLGDHPTSPKIIVAVRGNGYRYGMK